MGKDFLLAIDLGTSSLVVSLVDLAGNIVQSWQGEQETHFGPLGQAEQEARNWRELTCRGIRGVLERAGIKPDKLPGSVWRALVGCACLWIKGYRCGRHAVAIEGLMNRRE